MTYYLKHYFDPDFDHTKLAPMEMEDGSVDHYELSYVQNVNSGDLLAEVVELDDSSRDAVDSRFVQEDMSVPAGRGTGTKTAEPGKLYAARDGFVFYEEGLISVRQTLNVRKDVDFSTGNIDFVANLNVFGMVNTGFSLKARNIDIEGHVQGARVHALETLSCRSGVKGGGEAFLESGSDMKLAFCEYATVKAGGNVMVRGALLHSKVFAGDKLVVGSRMIGCEVYARDYVYVGEQLGGGMGAEMSVTLGYHPGLLYADMELDRRLESELQAVQHAETQVARGGYFATEFRPILEEARAELQKIRKRKRRLWATINRTEHIHKCRVLVPGKVKPGAEISIGSAYLKVDDEYEDVVFYFDEDEVKVAPSSKVK
ncbi:FapA family protein [Salidesulfovibrio onnuriiensis]|uniref:FapA family protein n=1 Tax=Salidesulfovibrio onnuriiensis TaxID=2583823 RepID=UPI0011C80DC2|nr:FapA family protein [Salidesulfovibrio onnuriiensis]